MSLGVKVCGCAGCDRPIHQLSVPCLDCIDTPDEIFDRRSNFAYCSIQNLFDDQIIHKPMCNKTRLWRTLIRVGAICNMFFMCREMILSYILIVSTYTDSGSDEALTLDPGSMQYGHVVKTHRHADYVSKYEREGHEDYHGFGSVYREVLDSAAAGDLDCVSLTVRQLNEAVWKATMSLGGRGRLYDMSHHDFVREKDMIGRRVRDALARFRVDVNQLLIDALVAEEDAPGHIAMTKVMENYLSEIT
ncbi:uncharacterized protein M421DRAFT_9960 [Didymella exigua CBS 183.55]|uniref:Uncharacterized protein n=1 Tax=Didymella exigua CBS 183.55 TaxID=1150837 RepID=A0A6A5R650_9PLEO|nr:uncharacterized protein M421DRAFT_9960 [Didymella exigua CBS 183.55]KAF1923053.1 hypothetical protein M421DRAFT_9960 [Didymella exigua CBS 183.55]